MKFANEFIPVFKENQPNPDLIKKGTATTSGKFSVSDPFIMPYDGKYYMYTGCKEEGMYCHVSDDLEHWSQPIMVYKTPENKDGIKHFYWAPECHFYKGKFYIFTSVFLGSYNHRIISCYRADNPLGPFEDIAGGTLTPTDWDAIDGTLYIDKKGAPWLVFVHEWTSMPEGNGSMVAARLSEDFTHLISEPIHLFYARDPDWTNSGVTDGPFLYRTDEGKLLMTWSNYADGGYVIALAWSDNGEIDGKWQQGKPIYKVGLRPDFKLDGGHGMIFRKFDGTLAMAYHAPTVQVPEGDFKHLQFCSILEKDGLIEIG